MLLTLLHNELRSGLHQAMPSWLSMSGTGRAIRKRQFGIRSWRNNWKLSSPDNRSATVRFPDLLKKEFRAFLDCGILARGFLRLHCQGCGQDRLLAFSCK